MRRCLAAVVALVVLGAVACGDGDGDGGSSPAEASDGTGPTTFDVGEVTERFVDTSRPTVSGDGTQLAPDRTLVTVIRYPEGDGPFPLVVLAHGNDGHPRKFVRLSTAWAEAGFVVALPTFPLTNDEAPGPSVTSDYVNQPADVSFVIDQVIALSQAGDGPLAGLVDASRIGVGGLSLGAATTYGVTFNSCCRDERIDAALIMAGNLFPFGSGTYDLSGTPLLVMHGDEDPALPIEGDEEAYAMAAPPKIFVTILGGLHAEPFEDAVDPADDMVEQVTTDYWLAFLEEVPGGVDTLLADADVAGLTTVRYEE